MASSNKGKLNAMGGPPRLSGVYIKPATQEFGYQVL